MKVASLLLFNTLFHVHIIITSHWIWIIKIQNDEILHTFLWINLLSRVGYFWITCTASEVHICLFVFLLVSLFCCALLPLKKLWLFPFGLLDWLKSRFHLHQFNSGQTLAQRIEFEAKEASARGNWFALLRVFACVLRNFLKCLGEIFGKINI